MSIQYSIEVNSEHENEAYNIQIKSEQSRHTRHYYIHRSRVGRGIPQAAAHDRRQMLEGARAGERRQLLLGGGRPVDSSWRAEEQRSGAGGPPAAFSLSLPVSPRPPRGNGSGGRFPARRSQFPRPHGRFSPPSLRIRLWRPLESSRRPPDAIRA
ncbi:unnamed protein product [Miscanthus lutarioriparius]|uniref:Uncharacterized protein n=1 Tax=Miscanthus lutarioriparius TaxID=422564 RepID=A0A811SDT3_9POAL|nr:unnamed protein product [Miscanthus lutarioriparius]